MPSAIAHLHDFGQSPWYDNLARSLLTDGGLQRLVTDDGIRGVTSNPTIFEKAMAAGEGYDEQLRETASAGPEHHRQLLAARHRRRRQRRRHPPPGLRRLRAVRRVRLRRGLA